MVLFFSWLIQQELDEVKESWNSHYIRRSCFDTVSGIPNILYRLPEYNSKHDCLVPVSDVDIEEMKQQCDVENDGNFSIYAEYFEFVLEQLGLQCPKSENEAVHLFKGALYLNLGIADW